MAQRESHPSLPPPQLGSSPRSQPVTEQLREEQTSTFLLELEAFPCGTLPRLAPALAAKVLSHVLQLPVTEPRCLDQSRTAPPQNTPLGCGSPSPEVTGYICTHSSQQAPAHPASTASPPARGGFAGRAVPAFALRLAAGPRTGAAHTSPPPPRGEGTVPPSWGYRTINNCKLRNKTVGGGRSIWAFERVFLARCHPASCLACQKASGILVRVQGNAGRAHARAGNSLPGTHRQGQAQTYPRAGFRELRVFGDCSIWG